MKYSSRGILVVFLLITGAAATQSVLAQTLKPVFKKGAWGYADNAGRIVIAPRFDAAAEFVDGLARVGMVDEEQPELEGRPNLKLGYIDPKGQVVVPLVYAAVRPFVGDLAAVAIRLPGTDGSALPSRRGSNLHWGYVDRQGEVKIPIKFLGAGDFSGGLAAVNVADAPGTPPKGGSYCSGPRNWGYIDAAGVFVIEPQFTIAQSFVSGRARVGNGGVEYIGRCLCCNPRFIGTYGYVDRSGQFTPDAKSTEGYGVDLELP